MKKQNLTFTFFIVTLLLASLACSISAGGPDYPEQTITVSPDEALNMQNIIEQALISGAETGVITVQLTEAQLTSFMAQRLAQQANPPFTDPQILLRNGQMFMYGKITRGWITANILITMNVTVDPTTNTPKIEIASADFGPFPAPEGINQAMSAVIEEAFTGSFGPVAVGFRLETITIADGIMTITGRIK
jgi:hypothetical protein